MLKRPNKDLHIKIMFHLLKMKKNIALFSDRIPRGIKFKELNLKINKGRIHLQAFPGARAQYLNHYIVQSLEEYDCAIIHVGINDMLRDKDENELKNILKIILNVVNSCRNHNINKVFISSIFPSIRVSINREKVNS